MKILFHSIFRHNAQIIDKFLDLCLKSCSSIFLPLIHGYAVCWKDNRFEPIFWFCPSPLVEWYHWNWMHKIWFYRSQMVKADSAPWVNWVSGKCCHSWWTWWAALEGFGQLNWSKADQILHLEEVELIPDGQI